MVRALRSLRWPLVDVFDEEEPGQPTVTVEPRGRDASIDISFVPGLPTVVIISGEDARPVRSELGAVMPHHDLDAVVGGYRQAVAPLERMAWLHLLAGVTIGEHDDPRVGQILAEAISDPDPELAALAADLFDDGGEP